MGAVYAPSIAAWSALVALKVMRPRPDETSGHGGARFQQEVRAAARLHHPNIVTAHDADQAGGLHFLVMEYVEGRNLADTWKRTGPLPVAEACLTCGRRRWDLQHAHEQGMVHRDIKPHNLMLQTSGEAAGGIVKILDFGLARLPARRKPHRPASLARRVRSPEPAP